MGGEGGGGLRKPARSSCRGGTFACAGPVIVVFTGQSPYQVSSLSTNMQINTGNAATASRRSFLVRQ